MNVNPSASLTGRKPMTRLSKTATVPQQPKAAAKAPPDEQTNVAYFRGRNLTYDDAQRRWNVDMPYFEADLIDLTPNDPLPAFDPTSYKMRVNSALIRMSEKQANAMVTTMMADAAAKLPVKNVSVAFGEGNVTVKATTSVMGLPLPVSVKAAVNATSSSTIALSPESVRVLGLPVLWAVKLFGVDLNKLAKLPADGIARFGKGATLNVDLTKTDRFEGKLSSITLSNGKAEIKLGGAPGPEIDPKRVGHNPNHFEMIARGEVTINPATVRAMRSVCIDSTPETPFSLNLWDTEGIAYVEKGDTILDTACLKKSFAGVGNGFKMKDARVVGTDLEIDGTYALMGLPFPFSFKLGFSLTPEGQLRLKPNAASFVGLPFGESAVLSAMADMKGAKRDGDSAIMSWEALGSTKMPAGSTMHAEPGRIVVVAPKR